MLFPEKVSPYVYTVLFENDEVKILKVMFELGKSDVMHGYGVITFYAVSGGKLARTSEDVTINQMDIAKGFAGHGSKLVKYQMINIGKATVEIILVEHKKLKIL